jgi:hypothetical protein
VTFTLLVAAFSFVVGLLIGIECGPAIRKRAQRRRGAAVHKREPLRSRISTEQLVIAVGVALVLNLICAVLYLTQRQQLDSADHDRQQALQCQVDHNRETVHILRANTHSAVATVKSELHLWDVFSEGIRTGDLGKAGAVNAIDDHRADLRARIARLERNDYPRGKVCQQLLRRAKQ